MKAQVTIEYLFLSLIALVLISFSVISLAKIKDSSGKAYDATLFRSSASKLANAMAEVCALGEGNSRAVYVKRNLSVEGGKTNGERRYAEFTDLESGISISRETYCEVEDIDEVYGKTKVKSEGGKIKLET